MTQDKIIKSVRAIRDQARLVQAHAESASPTEIIINHLWRESGKLHSMVNAFKSELAGNEEPKRG